MVRSHSASAALQEASRCTPHATRLIPVMIQMVLGLPDVEKQVKNLAHREIEFMYGGKFKL